MKRIKVIATLFILFSASMMNYHDQSMSSANFFNGSEMVMCTGYCQTKEIKACPVTEIDYSITDQKISSGKNYEANMVIM